ncbi:hypothetical protein [Nocardioides lianchengensis]|uniref:Uncharacterized protein n=1 Tax=Nocardioides lianchengensis TaxID=1045774 RepID=A0A1G6IWW0_9ACTN|nr:hypothetical protein [Nocardioides lianchengensis]NYG12940.1 hypothetical protein [Nocardioides lianchengensis]SDC10246.1 hypothetical protein SAMN05421872_101287 [Nocardioides lianchengensis]
MQRRVRRAAVTVAAAVLLTGCASDPEASPPAGVDELTIPTPSPDPDDFVDRIDNPWLALGPGESTTLTGPTGDLVLAVGDETTTVGGVAVTTMTLGDTSYLLAQDDDGNVWRFLEEGEAGLFMAATPRYGDGYRTAYDEGVVEERAEVTELEGDTLEIATIDPARPGEHTVATYENGTGLVRIETGAGVFER